MTMTIPNQSNAVSGLAEQIREAEDAAQAARHSGDSQALGYAESRALRAKRSLAKIDPRGYGYAYLGTLTQDERAKALAQ